MQQLYIYRQVVYSIVIIYKCVFTYKNQREGVLWYFYISLIIISVFVLWGVISPENLSATAEYLLSFTIDKFGWFYLLTTFLILGFSVYLAFSKYGNIRLGADSDRPKYSNITWFSMLFSAGMGIGLVFWGSSRAYSALS